MVPFLLWLLPRVCFGGVLFLRIVLALKQLWILCWVFVQFLIFILVCVWSVFVWVFRLVTGSVHFHVYGHDFFSIYVCVFVFLYLSVCARLSSMWLSLFVYVFSGISRHVM